MAKKNVNEDKELNKEETTPETPEVETEEFEETPTLETIEKEKYDELYDKHLRLMAEYDNFKKRTQKEKEELSSFVVAETVEKMLPVIDNLERAVESLNNEEKNTFSDGVEMVLRQFLEIFEKIGVEEIEALGKEFDPNIHNAVMHVDDENADANTIVEQFMKGYKYKDKVIRYSMVKVAN